MITVRSTINLAHQSVPEVIPVVQGDTGRSILFTLADFTIPTGATARYFITKPSGLAVYNDATIDGNTVLVDLTAQSLAEYGDCPGQVRVSVGDTVVTSFEFILHVEPFRGIDAVESTTESNIFDKAVEQAAEDFQTEAEAIAAEAIESIPADYTALSNEVDDLKQDANYQPKYQYIMSANYPATFFDNTDDWEQGGFGSGGSEAYNTIRVRTKNRLFIPNGTIIKFITANQVILYMWDTNGSYIGQYPSSWTKPTPYLAEQDMFVRLAVKNITSTDILPSEANTTVKVSIPFSAYQEINTIKENTEKVSDVLFPYSKTSEWEQGAIVNGEDSENSTRIRTGFILMPKNATLILSSGPVADAHYKNYFSIHYYNSNKTFINSSGWLTDYYEETFNNDRYIRVACKHNDSSDIAPSGMNITIVVTTGQLSEIKVLALGDSIGYGSRNRGNGFIGKTGCRYKNVAVPGASIGAGRTPNIIAQILGVSGYVPDAIITNGGINDYGTGIQMGDVPVRVIDPNNDNPETMDKTTVMGGLQYLFYKMMTLYPNAQRFFVMPHKTWNFDIIEGDGGWDFDTFYENVKKVCNMYGVKIVDIYTQSPINTMYSAYRSETTYSYTPPDTEKGWVNHDGVHPLPYGYEHGYTSYVREALKTVVPNY